MGSSKKSFSPRANLIISLCVAIAALIFFSVLNQKSDQKSPPTVAKQIPNTAPRLPLSTASENTAPNSTAQNDSLPTDSSPKQLPKQELPPDLQAQLNAPPPPLPEDLKRQLSAPPPELPEDLKAQLNAPPKELPDDIKKALSIPPRIVSIDEVNNPEGVQPQNVPQQEGVNSEKH